MSRRPELLILSFTDAQRDPRVFRQAKYLREHFTITVAALEDPGLEGVRFQAIRYHKAPTRFHKIYRATTLVSGFPGPFLNRFRVENACDLAGRFDLVLANDAQPLPLAFELAQGAPVVFDAHEYYPKYFENSLKWRILFKRFFYNLCREYIPKCACMLTVSNGIALEYRRVFGTLLPEVITSAPAVQQSLPVPLEPGRIRLIHHGYANPGRKIETMLRMMDYVDARFHLDLMLLETNTSYFFDIMNMARDRTNVTVRSPVPMPEIVSTINQYDIGICLFPPTTFNLKHCLPNKFFEFIQGRLAIAIGPSPEMATIVKTLDLGVVADDFTPQTLAAKLNALTAEDIMRYKRNSDRAAAIYNAEAEMGKLRTLLLAVLDKRR